MARLRILSLDGGGSWALIQVKALINLFSAKGDGTDVTGHDVLRNFDLAVANSGGTITLAGLIKNLPLSETLNYFRDEKKRRQIFVDLGFFDAPGAHVLRLFGIGPKYDTRAKLRGLKALFGTMGDLKVADVPLFVGHNYRDVLSHVVFCAFDYDRRREDFLRSDIASLAGSGRPRPDITVAVAAHAASNAPLNYFDRPAESEAGFRYWDGAVGGYNNPVLAGVIEALANAERYGTPERDIVALSIGTGNVALPLAGQGADPNLVAPREKSSIRNDLMKLATSILDDPPDAASFIAHVLLGCPLPVPGGAPVTDGRIVRMNPLVQPFVGPSETTPWILPPSLNATEFHALANLDMDAVNQKDVELIVKFCDLWLGDQLANQAIRGNRNTLAAEIGHARYSSAKAAWKALIGPDHGGVPIV